MKWVWNRDKTEAINLSRIDHIELEPTMSGDLRLKGTTAVAHGEQTEYVLGDFLTEEAAQEFISNLTQAAWAGNGKIHE